MDTKCTLDQPLRPTDTQPETFCLPVGSYIDGSRARPEVCYVDLVLVTHEVQGRGYYRRWGVFGSLWERFDCTLYQAPNHLYTDDGHDTVVLN